MKNIFLNPFFHLAIVLFLALGLEGYYSVTALSSPSSQPPLNTGYPPLDTGSETQVKVGSLFIGDTTSSVGLLKSGVLGFRQNDSIQTWMLYSHAPDFQILVYNSNAVSTLNSSWDYRNDGLLYYNGGNVGIGENFNPTALLSVGNGVSSLDFLSFTTTTYKMQLGGLFELGGDPYYTFAIGSNIAGNNEQYSGQPPLLSTPSAIFYTNNPINNNTLACSILTGTQGEKCNGGLSGFTVGNGKGIMFSNKDASVRITGRLTAGTISAVGEESHPDLPNDVDGTTIPAGKYTWGVSSSTCYIDENYYKNIVPIKITDTGNIKKIGEDKDKDKKCVFEFPSYRAKCPNGYFMTGIRFSESGSVVLECHTLFPYHP